jgi:hypothetical protein
MRDSIDSPCPKYQLITAAPASHCHKRKKAFNLNRLNAFLRLQKQGEPLEL